MDRSILARSVNLVRDKLPKFNDDLLLGLRKREIEGLMLFLRDCYRDFIVVVDLPIEMEEPFVVSPIERLRYELDHTGFGGQKTKLNIKMDEAALVRYDFKYNDHLISKYIYLPYLVSDSYTMVNGIRNDFHLNVSEALFSTRKKKGKPPSVIVKVIRVALRFETHDVYLFNSMSGRQFISTIVVAKIHNNPLPTRKKDIRPTAILYLLAKFGLVGLLQKLGYTGSEIQYTMDVDDEEHFEYIGIQNTSEKAVPVMVKIPKELCQDQVIVDIIGVMHYTMSTYRKVDYHNLQSDDIQEYLIFLGRAIYGKALAKRQAHQNMVMHIASTDNYLDSYYREIFNNNGVKVNDIYELIVWMWLNINNVLRDYTNNNMFNKRVDCVNSVVVDQYMRKLYTTLYKKRRSTSAAHMQGYVSDVLGTKISASFIVKNLKQCSNIRQANSIYNDNWLLSVGAHAIKRLGSTSKYSNGTKAPMNRYHPSMLYLESAVGFSNNNPSLNFYVNPYAVVDENGGVVKTEFATKVYDDMMKFLPN